ncbi:MAG: transketolase [Blastocatellia bacterium]
MEKAALANRDFIQELEALGNKLRVHSILETTEAGSGHPTSCMSAADLIAAVFFHAMRYEVANPHNPVNDRFVLSKGHAAPLLYAVLAEAGAFPVERLKTLRRFDSDLEGHPTPTLPWVDVATGSLGQGFSNAVGMALNGKYLDKVDYSVYSLMGDGEIAEGSIWEAADLASYYKLDHMVAIVDVNGLGQSQATMHGHDVEVLRRRFEAFGWHAVSIDGHDMNEIVNALDQAKASKDQPFAIVAATIKGKGFSFVEGKNGWHGKPFSKEQAAQALVELNATSLPPTSLKVTPPSGRTVPVAAQTQVNQSKTDIPYKLGDSIATREAFGEALARLGYADSKVVALDGDTKNSTFSEKFMKEHPDRFFEAFIAEQNMVGAAVGLAAMGKVPFASTFACFLTRAYDQIRMAAVSQANLKLCGSHAGVSIGEDGPSQMALEDFAMMRAIEGSTVLYPSDAVATENAVRIAARQKGIVYIRTSRPKTPVIYTGDELFETGRCKVVRHNVHDRVTVVAGGVTLFEALKAYERLKSEGMLVRVIDLFSVKPVDQEGLQAAGKDTNDQIITVEDHSSGGIGDAVAGAVSPIGIKVHQLLVREVPRSGKPEQLLAAYGIDADAIILAVKSLA